MFQKFLASKIVVHVLGRLKEPSCYVAIAGVCTTGALTVPEWHGVLVKAAFGFGAIGAVLKSGMSS
jgi:hypothetical protein